MKYKVEAILSCYKRHEYTKKCIEELEAAQKYENALFHLCDDGSMDETESILRGSSLPKSVVIYERNVGLRSLLLDFFERIQPDTEFICALNNDSMMPKHWMDMMLDVFSRTDADILSPDVFPSHAAFVLGKPENGRGYRPSTHVGGLWFMKRSLLDGMSFERYENVAGLRGAFEILNQIILDKEPKIGWVPQVLVQDYGHWSGMHSNHIKSKEHKDYGLEVGRPGAWEISQ